jgi:hypothetical protein
VLGCEASLISAVTAPVLATAARRRKTLPAPEASVNIRGLKNDRPLRPSSALTVTRRGVSSTGGRLKILKAGANIS